MPVLLRNILLRKLAAPRIVKEMQKAHEAGDYKRLEDLANAMKNEKMRVVRHLGSGEDAAGYLVAGHLPGATEQPGHAVMKVVHSVNGTHEWGMSAGLHARRLSEEAIPPGMRAKSYGYIDRPHMGIEYQEFVPRGGATQEVRQKLYDSIVQHPHFQRIQAQFPQKKLWDLVENEGNVRMTRDGSPRVIDAQFNEGSGPRRPSAIPVSPAAAERLNSGSRRHYLNNTFLPQEAASVLNDVREKTMPTVVEPTGAAQREAIVAGRRRIRSILGTAAKVTAGAGAVGGLGALAYQKLHRPPSLASRAALVGGGALLAGGGIASAVQAYRSRQAA